MKEQTETAEEKYALLKATAFEKFLDASFTADALKGVELFEIKAPSGMPFKVRRLDQSYVTNAGSLPMALTAEIAVSMGEEVQDTASVFAKMTPGERRVSMQASLQMIRFICVEPRVVIGDVSGQKNALAFGAMTTADFGFLANWAQGGNEAAGLKTFRRKRR